MARNTLVLHGAMKKRFGGPFTLDASTPAEMTRALSFMVPGFEEAIRAGAWRVVRGKLRGPGSRTLTADELLVNLPGEMHLIAASAGAKQGSGGAKVVLGAVLIGAALIIAPPAGMTAAGVAATAGEAAGLGAAAFSVAGFAVSYGSIAMFGASLAFGGISQMLSPTPKAGNNSSADSKPSFGFSGVVNGEAQGVCVPIGCGRMRIPGIPISVGIDIVDMGDTANTTGSTPFTSGRLSDLVP